MFFVKKISTLVFCLLCFQTANFAAWTEQRSGTLAWLHDVYFFDENKGFVAGSSGIFLATSDGGKTWTKRGISTSDLIEQIHFTNEKTGWLLCRRNQFNRGGNAPSYLMKTSDGGANWQQIDFSADGGSGREIIARIFSGSGDSLTAVGESGALFGSQNGGADWKRIASPTRFLLLDGAFADDSRGAIVGAGGSLLFSEDAGASWNKSFVAGADKTRFNRVFFVNKNNGWTVGDGGAIYQTASGGKSWRAQTSGTTFDLTDIHFTNAAEGWAVGDGGAILYTTTGGSVWTPVESKTNHKIERIFFVGAKGFAVGFGGTILTFDKTETPGKSSSKPQLLKRSN